MNVYSSGDIERNGLVGIAFGKLKKREEPRCCSYIEVDMN